MSRINLYTTFYNEKNEVRKNELLSCIQNNLNNPSIASVTVLNEGASVAYLHQSKLKNIPIFKRPTYKDFIDFIKKNSNQDDIHIIANTDIFFDKHIAVLEHVLDQNTCFALSRWDTTKSNKPLLYNHNDSQDVWIFKGPIQKELKVDFPLGVPRCDNRFLHELQEAGYEVLNPAFSIKAYHLHRRLRDSVYTEADNTYKIQPPYRYLYPHNIYGLWKTLLLNGTQSHKLGSYRYDIKKIKRWLSVRIIRKIFEVISNK